MGRISTVLTEMHPMRVGKNSSACSPSCGAWPGSYRRGRRCAPSGNADGSPALWPISYWRPAADTLRGMRGYIQGMRNPDRLGVLSGVSRTWRPVLTADGGRAIRSLWSTPTTFVVECYHDRPSLQGAATPARLLLHKSRSPSPSAGSGGSARHRPRQPVEGAAAPRDRRAVPLRSQRPPEVFSSEPRVSPVFRTQQHRLQNP